MHIAFRGEKSMRTISEILGSYWVYLTETSFPVIKVSSFICGWKFFTEFLNPKRSGMAS